MHNTGRQHFKLTQPVEEYRNATGISILAQDDASVLYRLRPCFDEVDLVAADNLPTG